MVLITSDCCQSGDRYKILGALQALPSGGVVPGAADGNGRTGGPGFGAAGSWPAIGATAAGGSSGEVALPHPALSSTARFTDQQGPSPSELVDPVLANARRLLASEPDLPIPAAGAEALSSTAPEAVDRSAERAPTPTLEDLGAVRGEFEAKKVEMAAMLSTHFEDAIMERNRLLQEAEVAAGRMVSALAAATAPHTHDAILPPLRRFQTTHRGLCFVAIVLCRAAHPKSGALNLLGFVCRLTFRESSTLCSLRWPSRRSS